MSSVFSVFCVVVETRSLHKAQKEIIQQENKDKWWQRGIKRRKRKNLLITSEVILVEDVCVLWDVCRFPLFCVKFIATIFII